jgi:hypothetical protein
MLPTLRTHGIIARARVGKYLLIIRCGLLRSSCVSYGEAFTRACAQIPPRPRNADIAAGNGLSDTFSMSPEPATH